MSKKNNEFSIEEYTSIRAELIERIKIMNSQEASALVAIITSWAAGFTFANEILTKKIYYAGLIWNSCFSMFTNIYFFNSHFLFCSISY